MKSLHFFLLLLSLLFTYACSASQHASQPQENNATLPEGSIQDDKDIYRSLADYLQQVPGVILTNKVCLRVAKKSLLV